MGDDKEAEEAIKAFQLVEFDPPNRKQKRGTIECVPSTWISYNPSTGRCQCKFMPPPYSVEDSELLCWLVKEQSPLQESWPVYPITLKGHATTYDDAMKRLKVLADKKFVYTEDGTLPEKKSEAAKKAYQRIKVKGDKAIAEKLMQVQPINTSRNDDYASNVDSSFETSDPIPCINSIKAKKKNTKLKYMTETDNESTADENSNVIKPRKKPKQKSKQEHASSTGKNHVQEIERKLSKRSSREVSKSTKNVPKENSSELNQRDCDILSGLRYDVQMLTKAIDKLKAIVEKSALAMDAHGANVQSFTTQYDLNLPVTTLKDFDAFDEKLKADKKFRKEFTSTLHFVFDHNATLPKNVTALLKKNISRDVALNFNAVKAGMDKRIFKETQLCGILLDVLLLKYKEGAQGSMTHVTEKSVYRELGNCLSNAVDWDGDRKSRLKKKAAKSTTIAAVQSVCVNVHCSGTSMESLSRKSTDKSS
ncbi:uncharacterized protein LOC124179257 isoform X1 [Neodiprion fabricii]|uniref:uncharacterized protein LOC124179257 isoform X1 n=1 Tax=Neodiprion fabricii TaxID=2872261 RepID=UPI001ED907B4|nr:uncharacterized protein LOC124179257 isoform X1 [Neodiprion fabricii]XP_046419444.1 uncharacterized protein LOC124179257 isoform X1 [Neodiprion fabricii]XP_046419445.1 uncharacterized protein LOC124179257 isoform X1 [Neodiprion fabricii]XP_046419446.1 uncharacterized protein LOC124179257 isoform X1 [Neodiprion fabricii]